MRILLTIGSLNVGGTETQLCRLARELRSAGHDVTVFTMAEGGPLSAVLDDAGIPWRSFGWRGYSNVKETLELWAAIRRLRPDICHAFLFGAYVLTTPGAFLARVPCRVQGRRGLTRSLQLRWFDRMPQEISNRLTHAFVANSRVVAEDAVRYERLPRSRMHVIYNGIDLPEPAPSVGQQPPTGLMVANLIPYKGHADLVDALAILDDPPVIRLVGIGAEEGAIRARIAEAGLEHVCKLEGLVVGAARLFRDVQFAVLCSHDEGLPNAVIEAMAAGVPPIATAVGGIPELIEDGVSGLLVPPKNPKALAEAIATLSGDPELRERMGAAARLRAARLSWASLRVAHLELYTKVLSGSRRGRSRLSASRKV